MQQKTFLLAVTDPTRGMRNYPIWTDPIISQAKYKSIHNLLGRDAEDRKYPVLDLLTVLCSHDSQIPCLSSQFQWFKAVGALGAFSNL